LVAAQLSKEPAKIKLTDRIVEDLGADSLDIVTMLMNLEETYGITIPDDDAMALKTVDQLVKYLEKNQA
jgi:acyl carrier protein